MGLPSAARGSTRGRGRTRTPERRELQELLGHASVAITLDTYSHMLPGMGGATADAMEAALS